MAVERKVLSGQDCCVLQTDNILVYVGVNLTLDFWEVSPMFMDFLFCVNSQIASQYIVCFQQLNNLSLYSWREKTFDMKHQYFY